MARHPAFWDSANVTGEDHDLIGLENVIRVDSSGELDNSANRNILRLSHDYGGIRGENRNDSGVLLRMARDRQCRFVFQATCLSALTLNTIETHDGFR